MKFISEKIENIKVVFIDGYSTHERLLEGVMIECRIVNDKIKCNFLPKDNHYTSSLNVKKLIKEIEESVNSPDFDSFLTDERGQDDAWIES